MKKKIFVLALALIMVISLSGVAQADESNGIELKTIYDGSKVLVDTNNFNTIITDYSDPKNIEKPQTIPVENINQLTEKKTFSPAPEEDKEINQLIDQLINCENQLSKEVSGKRKQDIEKQIEELKNKIESKGAKILTDDDLALLFGDNSKASIPSTPPTTANNYWFGYGPYSYSKSGTTYSIYYMRAIPRSPNSTLQDYFGFFSLQESNGSWLQDIATCYLQKVIGSFPIIEWLPYELLWNINSSNVSPSDEGDYYRMSSDIKTNMTFYWVNAPGDSYYELSLSSTRTSVTDAHHINWYHNNNLQTEAWTDPAVTKTAPYYNAGSSSYSVATQYYDSSYYGADIILTQVKYGFDGSTKRTCNVPYVTHIPYIN